MPASLEHRLATELQIDRKQVDAATRLLDDGASVPFIARYRKEATGGLDDTQLRTLEERLGYLRELDARRATILASIASQGQLSDALRQDIEQADTKQRLEDLYLPYKPKRRTKAQIAREAGLAPLAEALIDNPALDPDTEAARYIDADAGVGDVKTALEGARHILIERFSEDATLLDALRAYLAEHGVVSSQLIDGKDAEGAKFRDWFDFAEPVSRIPSHRFLALLRGRGEGVLRLAVTLPDAPPPGQPGPCEARIAARFGLRDAGRPADRWLLETARWAWSTKIAVHLELELMNSIRERAEEEAIRVFARNLKDLLLAAPAGPRVTIGLDPGIRTGVASTGVGGRLAARCLSPTGGLSSTRCLRPTRCLGAAGLGADQPAPLGRRGHRRRERPDHRHQRPVERQFAKRHGLGRHVARHHVQRRQERERDRQVEMRALLRQVGAREVDGDPPRGQRDRERRHGRPHPFPRLGNRLVGQAHDGEGRQPGGHRALDFHQPRLDPLKCDREGAPGHVPSPCWTGNG